MAGITPTAFFSGLTIINDLLSNFIAVDVVGIFDSESLQQVFFNARPLAADVRETSTIMRHPVETGTVLADNHIINPTVINLPLIIKSEYYNSVYSQIKNAFVNATKLLVQTRTGIYNNMIIANMPHREDVEQFDAITLILNLEEVLYVVPNSRSEQPAPANYSPANAQNSNTVQAGLKYATPLSSTNTAAVQAIMTSAAFKLGGL